MLVTLATQQADLINRLFDSILAESLPQAIHDAGTYLTAELVMVGTFLAAMLADFFTRRDDKRPVAYVVLIGTAWAFYSGCTHWPDQAVSIFSGMAVADGFASLVTLVLLASTFVCVAAASRSKDIHGGDNEGEFYYLILAVAIGGAFLTRASNLLMLYLNIEFLSLVAYVLAGYLRQNRGSSEAGLKYVIYGSLASGIMIFGMSYLYGMTGTLDVAAIRDVLAGRLDAPSGKFAADQLALLVVLLFVFAGFAYKIAAVPFHMWSPDVYEGAPTVATAFFSVAPKAAGIAALTRTVLLMFPVYGGGDFDTTWLVYGLSFFAVLTMTVGNVVALMQTNVKRMLAYSSIAHAGYMLAAILVFSTDELYSGGETWTVPLGASAVLFYLVAYLLMNLGAFVVVISIENDTRSAELKDMAGAVHRAPLLVVCMVFFLISLTGIPPMAGFVGKWFILWGLLKGSHLVVAIAVIINSVISLFYYMLIAKTMIFDPEPADESRPRATAGLPLLQGLTMLLAAGTLYFGIFFGGLREASWRGAADLHAGPAPVETPAEETHAER